VLGPASGRPSGSGGGTLPAVVHPFGGAPCEYFTQGWSSLQPWTQYSRGFLHLDSEGAVLPSLHLKVDEGVGVLISTPLKVQGAHLQPPKLLPVQGELQVLGDADFVLFHLFVFLRVEILIRGRWFPTCPQVYLNSACGWLFRDFDLHLGGGGLAHPQQEGEEGRTLPLHDVALTHPAVGRVDRDHARSLRIGDLELGRGQDLGREGGGRSQRVRVGDGVLGHVRLSFCGGHGLTHVPGALPGGGVKVMCRATGPLGGPRYSSGVLAGSGPGLAAPPGRTLASRVPAGQSSGDMRRVRVHY
jgi:hypothetical protein